MHSNIDKNITIGLITNGSSDFDTADKYQTTLSRSIIETAQEKGINILCYEGGVLTNTKEKRFNDDQDCIIYEVINKNMLDGLIISYTVGSLITIDDFMQFHKKFAPLPIVSVPAIPGVQSVGIDNENGMKKIIEHLIKEHNYKKIAYIDGPENYDESVIRKKAYIETLQENGIKVDPQFIIPGTFMRKAGVEAVHILLDKRKIEFEAIVSCNDNMALGAIDELTKRGYSVPKDFAVTGFDNNRKAMEYIPSLTTVNQPIEQMGREAVDMILTKINKIDCGKEHILPAEIVVRQSCGCENPDLKVLVSQKRDLSLIKTDEIIKKIAKMIPYPISDNWAKTLFDELAKNPKNIQENRMLYFFDKFLQESIDSDGELLNWNEVLFTLSQYFFPRIKNIHDRQQYSILFQKARSLLFSYMHKKKFYRQNELKRYYSSILSIGQNIIDKFEIKDLLETILTSIEEFNILACYLVLFENPKKYNYPDSAPEWSNIVLAYIDGKNIDLTQKRFMTANFLPNELLPGTKKYSLLVLALNFKDEQIGYLVLENSNLKGSIYKMLKSQISSALKGSFILRDHRQAEKEIRDHRDHLDSLIKKRTRELTNTNKELYHSKMNLRLSQSIAKLGNWEWEISTNSFIVSEEIKNMFELTTEKIDSIDDFYNYIYPDDLEVVKANIVYSMVQRVTRSFEFRVITPSDSIRWIYADLAPISDETENGNVNKIICVMLDHTDRRRAEEQLHQNQKMDALGNLTGGIAHDFNNILAGILSAAELAKSPRRKVNPESEMFINEIIKSVNRASDLIYKLLAFSRKSNFSSALVDIDSIIDDSKEIFERTLDKKIEIVIDCNADESTVFGDESALQSIIINLGINSSHAMPDGGILTISTSNIKLDSNYCKKSSFKLVPGKYLQVSVKDTGKGISPENVKKIFDPFFTTKKKGKGTGLGLSASYGTVVDHNGAIKVYSEIDHGTVFQILLPCADQESKIVQKNESIIHGSGTILLIDDDELIRITGKQILEDMGYDVIVAKNGQSGIELFKTHNGDIDVVLTDLIMPVMNGTEAFEVLRNIDKNCKIVLASGFMKEERLEELKKRGLDGYITKPYKDYELSLLLDQIINK